MPTRCPTSRSRRPGQDGASAHRGGDGPLGTCWSTFHDPLADAYTAASQAAGLKWNADLNSGDNEGIGRNQNTIRDGRRCSAAVAYLKPAMARPNLTVETGALVSRIVLERDRAVGVEYRKGGSTHTVRAHREVLLAGGVINSPQVLMLSGIGDPDALRAAGVKPQVALRGRRANLQDHVTAMISFERKAAGRHGAQVDAARPHRRRRWPTPTCWAAPAWRATSPAAWRRSPRRCRTRPCPTCNCCSPARR